MNKEDDFTKSTVFPGLHYRNAPAAIDWLCRVFGFTKHAVWENENGKIDQAELALNGGMLMHASLPEKDPDYGRLVAHPDEVNDLVTQSIAILVEDADEVFIRAKAAGARIVFDIENKSYGGRGFTCYDLEGYLWSVGTYNPWQKANH